MTNVTNVTKKEDEIAAITDVNLRISEILEDGEVHTNNEGDTEATTANLQLEKEFYHNETEYTTPTYVLNDTPAIKINPKN